MGPVTKHVLVAEELARVYTVSASFGLPFLKCDEIHSRCIFTTQTAVILSEKHLSIMFNRLDHLYIGHAGGSSREKGFN